MALFEPFPNCTPDLSVAIAMKSDGQISEIVAIVAAAKGAPSTNADNGTQAFMHFGDRVGKEARLPDGTPLFGRNDQRVVGPVRTSRR